MTSFFDRLESIRRERRTTLCVGIDPRLGKIPGEIRGEVGDDVEALLTRFGIEILELDRAEVEVVATFDSPAYCFSWSPDGSSMLCKQSTTAEVVVVSVATGERNRILGEAKSVRHPSLSPDGEWIAWAASSSDRVEIFLSSFPEIGRHWRVSREGGDASVERRRSLRSLPS